MTEFKTAASGETEAQFRQFLSYLFASPTRGLATSGVVMTGTSGTGIDLSVIQTATASASVSVMSGMAVQQASITAGAVPLVNNASKTLDVLGASPMGALPRNDLVVFDATLGSIVVVVGTPNASPSDPTPPNPSVPLARLRHAASATTVPTAKIDDLRTFTTLNVPAPDPTVGTYPVTWSQIGGATLSVGSGTLSGKYRLNGNEVTAQVSLTRAADSNVGTAAYLFSLPFVAADLSATGVGVLAKSGEKPLIARMINSTTVALIDAAGNRLSNTNPGGWAAGDVMQFTIVYFKA